MRDRRGSYEEGNMMMSKVDISKSGVEILLEDASDAVPVLDLVKGTIRVDGIPIKTKLVTVDVTQGLSVYEENKITVSFPVPINASKEEAEDWIDDFSNEINWTDAEKYRDIKYAEETWEFVE